MIKSIASLGDVTNVIIATNTPIKATVSPVCACVISSKTAIKNIIALIINFFLSLIASFGSG